MFLTLICIMVLAAMSSRPNIQRYLCISACVFSIFLIWSSASLGLDFENYNSVISSYGKNGELPDGWPKHEYIFVAIVAFISDMELDARALATLVCILYMGALIIKTDVDRIVNPLIICVYLPLSVFNGLRLGLGLSLFFIIFKSLYKKRNLVLVGGGVPAIFAHTSIILPILYSIIPIRKSNFLHKIDNQMLGCIVILAVLPVALLELFPDIALKINLYFSQPYEFASYGWVMLDIANGLIVHALYRKNRKILIFNFVIIIFMSIVSMVSYFGIRLLGLMPLAYVISLETSSDLKRDQLATYRAAMLCFCIIYAKNILFNIHGEYVF